MNSGQLSTILVISFTSILKLFDPHKLTSNNIMENDVIIKYHQNS
jgi:hypothetical protein